MLPIFTLIKICINTFLIGCLSPRISKKIPARNTIYNKSKKISNILCPRSSDPFHIVSYNKKWVTTSCTNSNKRYLFDYFSEQAGSKENGVWVAADSLESAKAKASTKLGKFSPVSVDGQDVIINEVPNK